MGAREPKFVASAVPRLAVRAREVAGSRPGARSFPPRRDLITWFSYVGTAKL